MLRLLGNFGTLLSGLTSLIMVQHLVTDAWLKCYFLETDNSQLDFFSSVEVSAMN